MAKPAKSGEMSQDEALEWTTSSFAHLPHEFTQKVYLLPKYCAICGGILLGTAWKCGKCGMRCHLGYGRNGHQDCHAEALLSPCEEGAESTPGSYKFGDLTAQKVRDARSHARRLVVSEVVKEVEEFGSLDSVKHWIKMFKSMCSTTKQVTWCVFGLQLLTAAFAACLSYVTVRWSVEDRSSVVHLLGVMQAASSVAALLSLEGVIAAGAYMLADKVRRNAVMLHVFVHDITKIDLQKLGIDLQQDAKAAKEVASSTFSVTGLLLVAMCGVWLRCVQSVS